MSVRKAFFWSIIAQAVSLAAMLVALIVLSRILNKEQMGVFATGQAVSGILTALTALGLGAYIQREAVLDERVLGTAVGINAIIALTLAAAIFICAMPIAALMGDPRVAGMLRWLALVPVISTFELLPQAVMQRDMLFRPLAFVIAARAITSTAVAISAAMLGAPYLCVAYGAVAAALVSAIASNVASPGYLTIRPNLANWRRMSAFGVRIISVGGFSMIAMRTSELMMGALLGLGALGVYSRASTIYNVIYANFFGSIAKVLMARLAVDQRTHGRLHDTYLAGLQAALGVMWPILLGLAVLSGPTVKMAFGPQWLGAAWPLSILMVAQAVAMIFAMSYELFILRDELGRQMRYEIFRSIAGFTFFAIGCYWGLSGAALGRLGDTTLATLMYVPHILRLAEVRKRELAHVLLINAGVTIAALVPPLALMIWTGFSPDTPLIPIILSVALGILMWFAALHLLGHPLDAEWRRALRGSRGALAVTQQKIAIGTIETDGH